MLVMTPGPTMISKNVRSAMGRKNTNTDLDMDFFEEYKMTCDMLNELVNSKKSYPIIMMGEALLGLEAACASIIEPKDKVLVIENGVFGEGFKDFVSMYGGEAVIFSSDRERGIDVEKLKVFLKENTGFKAATLVHCETPSGITNPIEEICPILREAGIISIVDAVSSLGGEEINMDESKIDILLGGSQKCLSLSSGLTIVYLSEVARQALKNRKTPVASYYGNLQNFIDWDKSKSFPYTMGDSLIYGLKQSLEDIKKEGNIISKHRDYASRVRSTLREAGFELYPKSQFSNTVTSIRLPQNLKFEILFEKTREKGLMLGGGLGFLQGQIFRIGHMGNNIEEENLEKTFRILQESLEEEGHILKIDMEAYFQNTKSEETPN